MTLADGVLILSALGVGAILREIVVALLQRRKLGADAVSVLTAAARDLVEPLSKELARERAEHAAEVERMSLKVAELEGKLEACTEKADKLKAALTLASVDAEAMRQERARDKRTIRELEARLRKH